LRYALTVALSVVTVLLILGEVGISVAPLLGAAGVAGIAVGFGAQSLVKDYFTGFFLLLENQIRLGDVIEAGGKTGAVEELTLRYLRLRDYAGNVSEFERTTVCGTGWVRTSDGREIGLDYALNMERSFHSVSYSETSGSVVLKDPLMLSFDGIACELTNQRINFDLAADGSAQWIPQPGGNSCFLVWDRNGNGRADDGRELFGAQSGNGFADLQQLDHDRNGWIDEADPAFNELGLWFADRYTTLATAGIGALFTGSVAAPFALKDSDNSMLGYIRDAGLFLFEDGRGGALQQVDLAVSRSAPGKHEPDERQQLTT